MMKNLLPKNSSSFSAAIPNVKVLIIPHLNEKQKQKSQKQGNQSPNVTKQFWFIIRN
jgi:hypothetical protein